MSAITQDNRRARYVAVLAALLLLLAVLAMLNVTVGSVSVPGGEVLSAIFGQSSGGAGHDIIRKVRLPRMTAGGILGGALALSGFLLQTFFNNPIAGPYVLGISSGAKLCVALCMVFMLSRRAAVSSAVMILAAFLGSMLSMAFVLLIARKVKRPSALILSGVMIGYICSAITDFVVTFASDESIVNLHNWSQGSFSGVSWENVYGSLCFSRPQRRFCSQSLSARTSLAKAMPRAWG